VNCALGEYLVVLEGYLGKDIIVAADGFKGWSRIRWAVLTARKNTLPVAESVFDRGTHDRSQSILGFLMKGFVIWQHQIFVFVPFDFITAELFQSLPPAS
jgi:hypothetical protein